MDLFNNQSSDDMPADSYTPLAERMRPRDLDEFVGQQYLAGPDGVLRRLIQNRTVPSMILWGPPGSGKTTLARIISRHTSSQFFSFSAVTGTIAQVRKIIAQARELKRGGTETILFVDEIHRFNKAQQDAFLPYVEGGTITLIGATTENPSFEVISALLSRTRVFTLDQLGREELWQVISVALENSERGLGSRGLSIEESGLDFICRIANGDGRTALNLVELASNSVEDQSEISLNLLKEIAQSRSFLYDKAGEQHYNLIFAFHKSLRGSDIQAALYWMARMLEAGEDPMYVARRMVRFANEDIGMADPQAVVQVVHAREVVHFVGMPEADLALAQACIYLATAPKSNRIYAAYGRARRAARDTADEPVPLHIRNAPTRLMKDLGYGKGYVYEHDTEDVFSGQQFLPESLEGTEFYTPGLFGFEKEVRKRLDYWKKLRRNDTQ